jgi:hypothetical protein
MDSQREQAHGGHQCQVVVHVERGFRWDKECFAQICTKGEDIGRRASCLGAWCGRCYTATTGDEFPITKPTDEEGFAVVVAKDKDRFLTGRNGDHFMGVFQCDLCHFRNIQKRDPDSSLQDALMLRCIRRANLDSFWARETATVLATGREMRQIARADCRSLQQAEGPQCSVTA